MSSRTPLAYVEAVRSEVVRMADAVRGVEPETTVPTCPEWTVADLVKHTGTVHRWAAQMVSDLATERLDPSTARYFRPRVAELSGTGESIALRGTDPRERWLIVLQPGGWGWGRSDGEATVHSLGSRRQLDAAPLRAADGERLAARDHRRRAGTRLLARTLRALKCATIT